MEFWVFLACTVPTLITISVLLRAYTQMRRIPRATPLPPPPGPAGIPLLSNLLYVIGPLRHNPHRGLASLAETYGPVLSLRLGLTRTLVVVSSAAAAHEALAKNDAALAARLVSDNVCTLSYSATSMVFLPSSDHLWRQLRVVIGAGFSSARGLDAVRPILFTQNSRCAVKVRSFRTIIQSFWTIDGKGHGIRGQSLLTPVPVT